MNIDIDLSKVELRTERLLLRTWRESDLDDLYEYASVDGVGQMAGWTPHKDKNESAEILNIFIRKKKTFAVEYRNKVIGSIGIENYNEYLLSELSDKRGCELGFVLSKDYWGKGFMVEAVREVIRYLFEESDLDFIICGFFEWNIQSKRVQEKCGFQEYSSTKTVTGDGKIENTILNILHKEEWSGESL
ncbi:MAG: GNAT family N-acetyltransferase [Saccharofermentanales bacterium]|jgi:ribosomal-protein-alanine N-acetyltransferase